MVNEGLGRCSDSMVTTVIRRVNPDYTNPQELRTTQPLSI